VIATPASVCVTLDSSEYLQAMLVGIMRACQNRKKRRGHRRGARKEDAEMLDIRGAVGEAIVAKHLGVYWLGVGVFRGDDVGSYQVRATGWSNGALLLHDDDKDDQPYISVYVCEGAGTILGWLYGRDGKDKKYWRDPTKKDRWAYFVPTSELRSIAELPR
jgi:hypothetical protein